MTRVRRAAAGAIVTAVAAGIAASSVGAQSPHARLYFLGSSGKTLLPVVRLVHALTPQNVLAALLVGPNHAQRVDGATSALPRDTRVVGVIAASTHVTVALQGHTLATLSTIPRLRVIGSLTYTLTNLPAIKSVRFTLNEHPWGVYDHAGRIIRDYRRGTLSHPWLSACAPAEGCFTP